MRFLVFSIVAVIGVSLALCEAPSGNSFDVLGRVLQPLEGVFFGTGGDARALECALEVSGVKNQGVWKVNAAIQPPDKARLEIDSGGQRLRVWKDGDALWVEPASLFESLPRAPAAPALAASLGMPITPAQFRLLPALVRMGNPGLYEVDLVDQTECRVLTFSIVPEVARTIGMEDQTVSVYCDGAFKPRRIEIANAGQHWRIDVLEWRILKPLPADVWKPAGENARRVDTATFSRLWESLLDASGQWLKGHAER